MVRTRLFGVALLSLSVLPGCGIFGNRPGLCERWHSRREARQERMSGHRDSVGAAMPVSYQGGNCNGCSTPIGGGPVIGSPGAGGFMGSETLPPPGAGEGNRIPPPKIKEQPGKVIELDPAKSVRGPVLTMPTNGTKPD